MSQYNLGTATGTIRIVYDSKGVLQAAAGVDDLEARLRLLSNVAAKINVDDADALRELTEVQGELRALSEMTADPNVDLDEAEAMAKLDVLTARLSQLDGDDINVKVKADTRPALTNVQKFREGVFSVIQLGIALSPALVPPLAAITVAAGGMVTALGAAGLGTGLFAGAAIQNLSGVKQAFTDLSKAQQAFNTAAAAGDKDAQIKAFNQMQTILAQLNPQERALVRNVQQLQQQWKFFAATVSPQTFYVAGAAIDTLRSLFTALGPILIEAANAFTLVATRMRQIAKSDQFQAFFQSMAPAVSQLIVLLSGSLFNTLEGLANIFRELIPWGLSFAQVLLKLSAAFASGTNSAGFQDAIGAIMGYVRENGPLVVDTLKNLALAVIAILQAASPLGPVMLQLIDILARMIATVGSSPFGPWVFGALSAALAARSLIGPLKQVADTVKTVSRFGKALGGSADALGQLGKGGTLAVKGLRGIGGAIKTMSTAIVAALPEIAAFVIAWGPWILAAAAVGAAIYLLYRNWNTVWNAIKTVFFAIIDFIIAHWKLLLLAIPAIGPLLAFIATYWSTIWNLLKTVFTTVIHAIIAVLQVGMGVLRAVISGAINAAMAVWNFGWSAIRGIVSRAIGFIMAVVGGVTRIVGIFTGALGSAAGAVSSGIGRIIGFFSALPGKIIGALGDVGRMLYDAGRAIVQGLIDGIESLIHTVASHLNPINGLKSVAHKILGINSPSKVFMEIGRSTMEGMALGIDKESESMFRSMTSVLQGLSQTPAPSVAAPAGAGAGTNISLSFSFPNLAGGPQAVATVQQAVASDEVLNPILQALRSGRRG